MYAYNIKIGGLIAFQETFCLIQVLVSIYLRQSVDAVGQFSAEITSF